MEIIVYWCGKRAGGGDTSHPSLLYSTYRVPSSYIGCESTIEQTRKMREREGEEGLDSSRVSGSAEVSASGSRS